MAEWIGDGNQRWSGTTEAPLRSPILEHCYQLADSQPELSLNRYVIRTRLTNSEMLPLD